MDNRIKDKGMDLLNRAFWDVIAAQSEQRDVRLLAVGAFKGTVCALSQLHGINVQDDDKARLVYAIEDCLLGGVMDDKTRALLNIYVLEYETKIKHK